MIKMRFPNIVRTILILILISACNASGTIEITREKTEEISSSKTVLLSITTGTDEESVDVAQRLRGALFEGLVSRGVFRQVLQPHETGDYRMDVLLGEVSEVSQDARIYLGVFAGANTLDAAVSLHEESTNRLVTAFNVSGSSASHPMSSEHGMEDAIREVVTQIILALE